MTHVKQPQSDDSTKYEYRPVRTYSNASGAILETDRTLVLLAWEAGVLDIDATCNVLSVNRDELLAMEKSAIERGLALAREGGE